MVSGSDNSALFPLMSLRCFKDWVCSYQSIISWLALIIWVSSKLYLIDKTCNNLHLAYHPELQLSSFL